MSYRNPLHGLDSNGDPEMSDAGVTLPAVTADTTRTTHLPAHVPVRPSGKCSIMCDHPDIDRDADHQAAVDSWKREAGRD